MPTYLRIPVSVVLTSNPEHDSNGRYLHRTHHIRDTLPDATIHIHEYRQLLFMPMGPPNHKVDGNIIEEALLGKDNSGRVWCAPATKVYMARGVQVRRSMEIMFSRVVHSGCNHTQITIIKNKRVSLLWKMSGATSEDKGNIYEAT